LTFLSLTEFFESGTLHPLIALNNGDNMNYGRIAMAAFAATIVFFAIGFLGEGLLFRKDFSPYNGLYRSSDALSKYMPIGLLSFFVAMFALSMIYASVYSGAQSGSAIGQGLRFGLLIGIFAACVHPVTNFVTMNLGAKLSAEITISTIVQWVVVGAVIAAIYKPTMAMGR
jgi:hypothetical protein